MVNVQYLTRISLFFEGLAVLSQIVKSGAADLEFIQRILATQHLYTKSHVNL